jgi:hypothetical protein
VESARALEKRVAALEERSRRRAWERPDIRGELDRLASEFGVTPESIISEVEETAMQHIAAFRRGQSVDEIAADEANRYPGIEAFDVVRREILASIQERWG